jgi:hypothetical protein
MVKLKSIKSLKTLIHVCVCEISLDFCGKSLWQECNKNVEKMEQNYLNLSKMPFSLFDILIGLCFLLFLVLFYMY